MSVEHTIIKFNENPLSFFLVVTCGKTDRLGDVDWHNLATFSLRGTKNIKFEGIRHDTPLL